VIGTTHTTDLEVQRAVVRSRAILWVLGGLAGVLAGAAVMHPTWMLLGGAAVAGVGLVAAIVMRPELGPTLFWLAFSLQSTLFFGFMVTGLYYPLYALMVLNVLVALVLRRVELHARLLPYVAFLTLVLAGLLPLTSSLTFDGYQRLFIYAIGFLVYFQFSTRRVPMLLLRVQVLSMLVIATWVVVSSVQGGFGPRGSITVNQNDVSLLLGFGILALVAQLMGRRTGVLRALPVWGAAGFGIYAMLLLASRGMSIAVGVAVLAMFGRILLDARRSLPVLGAAIVAGLILCSLPGSGSLLTRFQASDVATANDRVPMWNAVIGAVTTSDAREILLGHGFESSKTLIADIRATTSTHNGFLQMLYEFGILGLSAFVALHGVLLARFWKGRSPVALYGAGVATFLLMTNMSMTAPDRFLYWVAVGYLLAVSVALDRAFAAGVPGADDGPAGGTAST
jgi:hypothetical protein